HRRKSRIQRRPRRFQLSLGTAVKVSSSNATSQPTVTPAEAVPWHVSSPEQLLQQLGSSRDGLSSTEAARRLAERGPNELQEARHISALPILLGQFKSLIVWILIVAGVVAG